MSMCEIVGEWWLLLGIVKVNNNFIVFIKLLIIF